MSEHKVMVTVKVGTEETEMRVKMLEADGSWYLIDDVDLDVPSSAVAALGSAAAGAGSAATTGGTATNGTTTGDTGTGGTATGTTAAAAGGGKGGYAQMVAKLTGFKDRMCACKDQACINGVSDDMTKWGQDQATSTADMSDVNDALVQQMSKAMEDYSKCMSDAIMAGAGGTTATPTGTAPATPTATPTGTTATATPTGTATATAAAAAAPALAKGDRVSAQWTNGSWYPGKISAVNADGTYDIAYDDGDRSKSLPASKVRKAKAGSSSGTKSSSSSSASDAPCPGPGITRRCSGRCVNLQEDDNNCGSCGNVCPSGKHCDGHLFCRDAEGNL
jgi:hypothetical protein